MFLSPANVQRLATLVGQGAARDLLLTARTLAADEAAAVGLVQRRVPDALEAALELAAEVAELAPLTVQGHKRALNLVAGRSGRDRPRRDAGARGPRLRQRGPP